MSELIERQAAIDAIHCDITVIGKENADSAENKRNGFYQCLTKVIPAFSNASVIHKVLKNYADSLWRVLCINDKED